MTWAMRRGPDEFHDLGDIAVFVELDFQRQTGGLGISQKPILVQMP